MPPQFKLYKEIKAANDESEKIKREFDRTENIFKEKFAKINEGEIEIIQLKNKIEQEKVRQALLQMKLEELQKTLDKETVKNESILKAFAPGTCKVKNDHQVVYQHEIDNILNDCHKELTDFYRRPLNETNSEAAQLQIWQSMQELIDPVPRSILWRALMTSQGGVISNMKMLTDTLKSHHTKMSKKDDLEASLDYATTFINVKEFLASLNIKINLKPKVKSLSSQNDEALGTFACQVDDTLNIEESQMENRQNLIEQFVLTIAKHLVLDAEIKFLNKTMENIRSKQTELQQKTYNQGTNMMIEATHSMYNELESLASELEVEVSKIYQLKNKLESVRRFNEDFVRQKFRMNTTVMGSNSITANFNAALGGTQQYAAQTNTELDLFKDFPIDKLKYQVSAFRM